MGPASLLVLILAAVAFATAAILLSKLVLRATHNEVKGEPYECGVPTIGKSWTQLNVGYYLFALIFLIFDVELIFLYPWAVSVQKLGMFAFVEALVFLFILFLGFLYAHKKGALKWV